jgi:hypothetical protein
MKPDALRAAVLAATLGAACAWADTPPENRAQTPAEQAVEQGSGTSLGPGGSNGSGATTTGYGDAKSSAGISVDNGTVMRPLSAQGRNSVVPKDTPEPPRRKQLYGLNPKADEPVTQSGR